mgnify:CR=1 FL=1
MYLIMLRRSLRAFVRFSASPRTREHPVFKRIDESLRQGEMAKMNRAMMFKVWQISRERRRMSAKEIDDKLDKAIKRRLAENPKLAEQFADLGKSIEELSAEEDA